MQNYTATDIAEISNADSHTSATGTQSPRHDVLVRDLIDAHRRSETDQKFQAA